MIKPTLKIDERFKKRVQARYERFNVQGGILQDKPHHEPRPAKEVLAAREKVRGASKPKETVAKKAEKKTKAAKKKKTLLQKVKGKAKKALTSKKAKEAKRSKALAASHRRRGLGTLEGGPVRLKSVKTRSTTATIAERIRTELGIDWLRTPVRRENTPEMKALRKAFFDLVTGKNRNYSAVETKFRAVLRIPILKKRYGRNTPAAAKEKTFNRFLIDTGQFFKAIVAKVSSNKGKK